MKWKNVGHSRVARRGNLRIGVERSLDFDDHAAVEKRTTHIFDGECKSKIDKT